VEVEEEEDSRSSLDRPARDPCFQYLQLHCRYDWVWCKVGCYVLDMGARGHILVEVEIPSKPKLCRRHFFCYTYSIHPPGDNPSVLRNADFNKAKARAIFHPNLLQAVEDTQKSKQLIDEGEMKEVLQWVNHFIKNMRTTSVANLIICFVFHFFPRSFPFLFFFSCWTLRLSPTWKLINRGAESKQMEYVKSVWNDEIEPKIRIPLKPEALTCAEFLPYATKKEVLGMIARHIYGEVAHSLSSTLYA
jgi:hypothetical protein